MNPGDKIIVMKGARVFFSTNTSELQGMMKLDRDIPGEVLSIYPDGSPNRIDMGNQTIVMSGLNWTEGKDFKNKGGDKDEGNMG